MAAQYAFAAVFMLALVLLCSPAPAAAAEFTAGLTIDTYKYYFNVTSYANVSMDVKDMFASIDAGNYAEAERIYVNGKNAWRSLTSVPPSPRNAKPVVGRNYTTAAGFQEPWWLLSTTYFSEIVSDGVLNTNAYLDKVISESLAAKGDWAPTGRYAAYRSPMLKAYLTFYPTLYWHHELDAGYTALMANPAAVRTGHSETDHGVGCYTGITPASTETNTVRVATDVTPWEVSEKVGEFMCTTGKLKRGTKWVKTSNVNLNFLAVSKKIQNLFVPPTGPVPTSIVPAQLLALRLEALKVLNVNQLQLTLRALYNAGNAASCTTTYKSCKPAEFAAEAHAHWRMAQPALASLGITKGRLQAVEALLDPAVWKAAASDTAVFYASAKSSVLKKVYKQAAIAVFDVALAAGYMRDELAKCKLTYNEVYSMSVNADQAVTEVPAAVVGAEDAIVVASAAAEVAEPSIELSAAAVAEAVPAAAAAVQEPVAAALVALMATPANPMGPVDDSTDPLEDAP